MLNKINQKKNFSFNIFKKIIYIKIFYQLYNKNFIFFNLASFIPFFFKYTSIYLYKGSNYKKLYISTFNIGLRMGIFVNTRKNYKILVKKKKR